MSVRITPQCDELKLMNMKLTLALLFVGVCPSAFKYARLCRATERVGDAAFLQIIAGDLPAIV